MSADVTVDARGMLCPWPVLRFSRAARELGGAGRILLLADDPATASELSQLCVERGWQMIENAPDRGRYVVVIH
jgi:tRNA 2-thiouridine synthesizing protein A